MRMLFLSSSLLPSYAFSLYGGGASVYRAYSASMRWTFELDEELESLRWVEWFDECVDGEGKEWYEELRAVESSVVEAPEGL